MRYEDATNSPGSPFAIGVTLKELSVFTTDAQGNRKFVTDTRAAQVARAEGARIVPSMSTARSVCRRGRRWRAHREMARWDD